MSRLSSYILMISIAAAATTAPSVKGEVWSLDSCITYAIDHNINVRQRALEATSADLSVTEAKDLVLPQLNAGASQSFNFGRGLTSDNTYANRNTSQFGWSVNLSLPLFQGLSAKRQLDYARANLSAILRQVDAAKDDVTLQVIAQYLQVLYTKELHEVATEQVRISSIELERRRVLLDAGKIAALDLTQAESQLAQDELTLVNTANDVQLSLLNLAQLLQLPDVDNFDIASADSDSSIHIPNADEVFRHALTTNNTLQASQLSISAADKYIAYTRTGYIPRLSFNAGLGSSYYNINGFENATFHRQMRDNFNKSIGFTLSIPIFDAFQTRNAERRAKVQRLNAELQYDNARSALYQAIQQAYYQADAARAKLTAATVAREAAKKALDAMEQKYNFGRANATEFEEAKSAYIKAASEAVQAKYETLLRVRILQFYNRN